MAIYVVSDVHGYYDVFLKGLEVIDLKPTDMLYMVGDAIDRGPDGIEILKYIKNHRNMDLIIGNHEFMMLNSVDPSGKKICEGDDAKLWLVYNGGKATYTKYCEMLTASRIDLLEWLRNRLVIKTLEHKGKKFCLTHSYYMPDCENKTYSELSYDDVWEIVWKSMYRSADTYCPNIYKDFDCTFITGHVPVQTITKDDEAKPYVLANFIDIDGGCRAGAKPGLGNGAIFMRLDDMQDFIVPMIVPKQGSIFF